MAIKVIGDQDDGKVQNISSEYRKNVIMIHLDNRVLESENGLYVWVIRIATFSRIIPGTWLII